MHIAITELERAINHWRNQRPALGEECTLSAEVAELANIYGQMIYYAQTEWPLASLSPHAQELIKAAQQ